MSTVTIRPEWDQACEAIRTKPAHEVLPVLEELARTVRYKADKAAQQPGPLRVKGHTLASEGLPFDEDGTGPYQGRRKGYAKCSCGAMSPYLHSDGQRKRWHRHHKAAVRLVNEVACPANYPIERRKR